MSKAQDVLKTLNEATNPQVIDMFSSNSFPKDKKKEWGTKNLKIRKEDNGWALINYTTPLAFRNDSGVVFFNTEKYSPTTSTIQNKLKSALGSYKEVDEKGIRKAIESGSASVSRRGQMKLE